MRLIGYSCQRPASGIRAAYLPLDSLTVLVGANDAGKSTLLRVLAEDLRGGPVDADFDSRDAGAFFAELTDAELNTLLKRRRSSEDSWHWPMGGYETALRDAEPVEDLEAWLATLIATSTSPPSFEKVIERLGESRIVCLDPIGFDERGRPRFTAFWCLPPLSELDEGVRGGLDESELLAFARSREVEGEARRRLPFRVLGRPSTHLWADGAPVVVAPLSWSREVLLPLPLIAPAGFAEINEAIAEAVTGLVAEARFGVADGVHATPLDSDEKAERQAPRIWLSEGDEGTFAIDPVAVGALRLLAGAARRLLPRFVSDRYELSLGFEPIDRWFANPPIRLWLTSLEPGPMNFSASFPIEGVADGFRLWLQLALGGAIQEIAELTRVVGLFGEDVVEEVDQDRDWQQEPDGGELLGSPVAQPQLDRLIASISAATEESAIAGLLAAEGTKHHAARSEDTASSRLFIVDEPERHLEPRLARHAASWLLSVVEATGVQIAVASHGTSFLGLAGDVTIARVRRLARTVDIATMSPEDAATLDALAADLGLDRGELLTVVGCFLLVEGEHDKLVLETLWGSELRAAGVFIAPMRGSGGAGLFDSETLWRFTTAPALMVSDNLDPELVRLARDDPEEALKRLAGTNKGEERALQAALKEMRGTGKQMHFAAHHGRDLIDALDEKAVQTVHPAFPGHVIAAAAYEAHSADALKTSAKPLNRKSFYEKEYKIPAGNNAYGPLAEAHSKLGLRPAELQAIVDEAIRLATDFRTPAVGATEF